MRFNVSKKYLMLMFLLTIVFSSTLTAVTVAPPVPTPTIYIDPPKSAANLGETFSVNINVADVINLYAWGVYLSWHAPILNCTGITQGEFLKRGGKSTFFPVPTPDNVKGEVYISCTRLGAVPGENGTGILATVTFKVKGTGECVLDLHDTKLLAPGVVPITHAVKDGYFYTPVLVWYANLIHRKAWPEKHHFVLDGKNNTLYALVRNLGTQDVWVKVKFKVVDASGKVIVYETAPYLLTLAGGDTILSVDFEASIHGPSRYSAEARCFYDANGDGSPDTGTSVKTFSFSVV